MRKLEILVGVALACAPALALAQTQGDAQGQGQYQGTQGREYHGTQGQQYQGTQGTQGQEYQGTKGQGQHQLAQGQYGSSGMRQLLPSDATLIGMERTTEVRAFPEQAGTAGAANGSIQNEAVVGVGGVDRVWTTGKSYSQTVQQIDHSLSARNVKQLARTTTATSTSWNLRMPDGHIANLIVRNTQPTTIESIHIAGAAGTVTPGSQSPPR